MIFVISRELCAKSIKFLARINNCHILWKHTCMVVEREGKKMLERCIFYAEYEAPTISWRAK